MKVLARAVFGLSVMALAVNAANAKVRQQTVRQQAETACYNDVTVLCPNDIPNEEKIKVCMTKNRAKLSAACRNIFDAGMK